MAAPLTPNEVVIQLTGLARDLAQTVMALESADKDATEKRAAYDLAFSRAFLSATGSVEHRKHEATVEVHQQRLDSDVAEAVVRHLRRKIDALKVRIDVGRSYSAAVRAELSLSAAGVD